MKSLLLPYAPAQKLQPDWEEGGGGRSQVGEERGSELLPIPPGGKFGTQTHFTDDPYLIFLFNQRYVHTD